MIKSDAERCAEYEKLKRIDNCETPREMAEKSGLHEIADLLAVHERSQEK